MALLGRKNIGLLDYMRVTHIDEEKQNPLTLALLSPNKENILTLNFFKKFNSWEKQEKIIYKLLSPISDYYQKNSITEPVVLYWQSGDEGTNWAELIKYEANNLTLPFESIEKLPCKTLSEWLPSLYENSTEPKLYIILTFQLESTSSEEAVSLLLAPQILYERLHLPIKAKLLRPISCDIESFFDALKTQCEFQYANNQLDGVWHSNITEKYKNELIQYYTHLNIPKLSEHLYDIDMFFGKGDITRYSIALSFASEFSQHNLIVHQDKDNFLLQLVKI